MKAATIAPEVLRALAECGRGPGWSARRADVRRFELVGKFGFPCMLYVVPFRCWAYRRVERRAAECAIALDESGA